MRSGSAAPGGACGHHHRSHPGRAADREDPRRPRKPATGSGRAHRGHCLPLTCPHRAGPARARHHTARPGPCGQQPPGQSGFRLRQGGFHHRLGQRAGHLPAWRDEHVLDHAEHLRPHLLSSPLPEAACKPCPDRALCTASTTRSRSVAVLPRLLHEIQMRNRLDQQTEQWQRRYAIRAGIEATLSQNVRAHGLRRARYRGLARTHVQHVLTAIACNLSRLADWYGTAPAARRPTRFRALCNTEGFAIT
ncbi:transposase [Streptomyces sp. NPDC056468]|uniref:transposase n=1 Tax=Streptomyces sp. NPDC056468 TaxID=3345830 RepID=UPI003685A9FE